MRDSNILVTLGLLLALDVLANELFDVRECAFVSSIGTESLPLQSCTDNRRRRARPDGWRPCLADGQNAAVHVDHANGTLFFYVLVEVSLSLRSRLSSIASACMTVSLALLSRCCSSRTAFNSELMRRFCKETVSTFFRASVSARRIACRSTSARCHSRFTALKRDCKSAYLLEACACK